ncbi:MAG: hypothetical protein JWM85_3079 [Acidimicrobiaceae bacterium]|nr:hypothetical protein [Acidimicrobiaceae bacterium]
MSRPLPRTTSAGSRVQLGCLSLAALWVLDGLLQLQPAQWGNGLSSRIAGGAMGEPSGVAHVLLGASDLVARAPLAVDLSILVVQLGLGAVIARRSSRRLGLTCSIAWALGVWVIGEGFGSVPSGFAMLPVGGPGPALVYALLAWVLLAGGAPAPRAIAPAPQAAERVARRAALAWSAWWLCGAVLQLVPVVSLGFKMRANLVSAADGEPGPLAALDRAEARLFGSHGSSTTLVLVALELCAAALPLLWAGASPPARAVRVAALGVGALLVVFWVGGENLGTLATGSATDVGAMPVLALLGWMLPRHLVRVPRLRVVEGGASSEKLGPFDRRVGAGLSG